MEEPEVFELYEVHYSDLLLLCSTISSSSSLEEAERLKLISRGVMEALGPEGPGLLSITGVPEASTLQRHLLPLARRLALLNPDDRKRILKVIPLSILFPFSFVVCGHLKEIINT